MNRVLLAVLILTACSGTDEPDPTGAPVAFNEIDIHGRDWVELVNLTDEPVDLSGWVLADDKADATNHYALPSGTVLDPDAFLAVKAEKDEGDGLGFAFGLKAGDTVYLLDAAGAVVLEQPIGAPADGRTWGRLPDATGAWQETNPTQGLPNGAPQDLAAPLFDDTRVVTIDLTLDAPAIAALKAAPDEWTAAAFRLTTPDQEFDEVAVEVRLKGGLSFTDIDQKPSFKVGFNKLDKEARFLGLKNLTLNNLVDDASAVREVLGYHFFTAAGLPSLRAAYADVRVNGERRGLYVALQAWDDVTLDGLFDSTEHLYEGSVDLYVSKLDEFDVDEGDETDKADLLALLAAVGGTDGATWLTGVEPVVDLDQALRFVAAEGALGHADGYAWAANNYFLHSNKNGRFSLLPWGLDRAFAEELEPTGGSSLLVTRCLGVPACASDLADAADDVLAVFTALDWEAEAERLDALVRPYCDDEPEVACTLAGHDAAVDAVKALLAARAEQAK
jgi:hypothetical protein